MRQNIFGRSIVGRAMEILLVEPDLDEARAALDVLDRGNVRCRVSLVRDGTEALAFLHRIAIFARAPRPDLIILAGELTYEKNSSSCVADVLSEIQRDNDLKLIPMVVLCDDTCDDPFNFDAAILTEIIGKEVIYLPKPLDAERFVRMVKRLHFSLLTQLVSTST